MRRALLRELQAQLQELLAELLHQCRMETRLAELRGWRIVIGLLRLGLPGLFFGLQELNFDTRILDPAGQHFLVTAILGNLRHAICLLS